MFDTEFKQVTIISFAFAIAVIVTCTLVFTK